MILAQDFINEAEKESKKEFDFGTFKKEYPELYKIEEEIKQGDDEIHWDD